MRHRRKSLSQSDSTAMTERRNGLTYADSGVDIDAGEALVERIKPLARSTRRPGADAALGGFGGLFDLKACGFRDPVLVAANDGVGTKLKLAIDTGVHGGVGELKLPLGELGGFGRKDHALVRAGWKPPSSKRSGAVEETLTYAIKELAELGQLPTRMGYEIAGWVDHRTHVRPGSDLYVGQALGSTARSRRHDHP